MYEIYFYEYHYAGMFSTSELKHLVEESKLMSKFDHPNVMKLFGVAISKRHETLYVLMPYMTQGSLLSYLKKHRCDLMVEYDDVTDSVSTTSVIDSTVYPIQSRTCAKA